MKIFIDLQKKQSWDASMIPGRNKDDRTVWPSGFGWSSFMIAQALRLHQTTADHHIHEFATKEAKPETVIRQ